MPLKKKECLMSLKKFADADLYTNKSGRQRRGRRKDLQTGVSLDINGRTIVVLQDIPAGHKVAYRILKKETISSNMVLPSDMHVK